MLASERGHLSVVQALLGAGADPLRSALREVRCCSTAPPRAHTTSVHCAFLQAGVAAAATTACQLAQRAAAATASAGGEGDRAARCAAVAAWLAAHAAP